MQKELREEIINLIVSKSLRKYLLAIQEEVSDRDLVETIGAAPISLKNKKKLLTRCAKDVKIEEKTRKRVQDTVQDLEKAFSQLYNAKKGTLFMLESHNLCSIRGLQKYMIKDSCCLAQNFETARKYMERELFYYNTDQLDIFDMTYEVERKAYQEKDWKTLEQAWLKPPHWFWKLYLIDTTHTNGIGRSDYQFICAPNGEVQYVCSVNKVLETLSGGRYYPPVPYQSGDILHVDCSPYAPGDCYCLILETYSQGIKCCLYPTLSGKVGFGRIEKGYYYENENTYMQYLPPLFCAELNENRLPENCVFMPELSQKLSKNQKLGKKLSERFYGLHSVSGEWASSGSGTMGRIKKRGRFDEEEWHIEQEILFEWMKEWGE